MKTILLLVLLSASPALAAETQNLFFARETKQDSTRVSLIIEGDQVHGTQTWQPKGDAHGSQGTLSGTLGSGGIIRVRHEYTIEGSDQSEEMVLKLDGKKLFIGEGELVEAKNDLLKLKEPSAVRFAKSLEQVVVAEPKAGTPERKAIMDAMRDPVAAHVGQAVLFTGTVRVSGNWARFQGEVKTADGTAPQKEAAAGDLELDFFALLKKDAEGVWRAVHWGFAGDIGVREEAREKFPQAPWVLFE